MTFQPWNVGEIVNNTGDIYQNTTNTTALGNGGYVITWRDGAKIRLQVYDGDGKKVGSAQFVDLEGTAPQIQADVQAIGPDGGFVVTWTTQPSGSNTDVFARKFSATGTAGDIYSLTPSTASSREGSAAMAAGPDGGWASVHTNAAQGVTLVRYDVNGSKIGEVNVAPSNSGTASEPDVTWLGGNRYVVSYVSNSDNRIHFKLVDGNAVSTDAQEGTTFAGSFSEAVGLKDASGNLDGSFVVISDNNDFIMASVYTSSGTAPAFVRNITIKSEGQSTDDAKVAGVTALKDGAFAVAYVATNGTDRGDIFVTVIDKNGVRTTSPALNVGPLTDDRNGSGIGDQYNPVITELADGRLAITWEDRTFPTVHVMTRIFDPRTKAVTVEGSTINDIYHGTEYDNDILRGGAGNDALYGGGGNDNFNGGAGADRFVGGDHLGKDNGNADNVSYWGARNAQGQLEAVEIYLWDVTKNKGHEAVGDTYSGIEVISGTTLNDVIEGDNSNNTFWGDDGNDVLKGFGGNDTLQGSKGADTFYGGAGADSFHGGLNENDRDTVTYEFSTAGVGVVASLRDASQNTGEAQGDNYNNSIDHLVGTNWNDILIGSNFVNDNVNDWVSYHNKLSGGGGDDILEGGQGNDTLDGGTGFNFASYAGSAAPVRTSLGIAGDFGRLGDAVGDEYVAGTIQGLIGGAGNDTLAGSDAFANEIRGGAGDDEVYGGAGNDTLMGGVGADKLFGGADFDFASYLDSTAIVAIALPGSGNGTVAGDTFESIEGLIGSNHDDSLTGNEVANVLRGEGGNDTLNGGAGNDTLEGGTGSDTYRVAGRDRIVEHAGQGTDTVVITADFVVTGNDFANIENFILDVSTINNTLSGNEDANALTGNDISNRLEGLGGNDVLNGLGSNDALFGGAGHDVLDGGTGIDAMDGGIGNDIYHVNDLGDQVTEAVGGGIDTVYASVNFALTAGTEVEFLYATGSAGVQLKGSSFANTIIGNEGANKIYGGLGNDQLRGGTGKDTFVFDTAMHKTRNVDKILDFNVRDDSIWLENKIFTKLGSGSLSKPKKFNSDMFVVGNKAQDREDRIIYDKKSGALYYDKDGTGGAAQVKIATLTKNLKMTYADFFVI